MLETDDDHTDSYFDFPDTIIFFSKQKVQSIAFFQYHNKFFIHSLI